MDDAFLVRGADRRRRLRDDRGDPGGFERAAGHVAAKRARDQPLEDQEQLAVTLAEVEDLHRVRVADHERRGDLPAKPPEPRAVGGELGRQHLDVDRARGLGVPRVVEPTEGLVGGEGADLVALGDAGADERVGGHGGILQRRRAGV